MTLEKDSDSLLDSYLGITDETRQAEKEGREEGEVLDDDVEDVAEDEEAEGDDTEAADDEEAEGSEEAEGDEAAPAYADKAHKVKLDDGSEVTVQDLILGNMRNADYTHKNTALANQRKEYETRLNDLAKNEQALDLAIEIVVASVPDAPSPQLAQTNAAAYLQQKVMYDARMEEVGRLLQAKQGLSEAQKAEAQRGHDQWVMGEAQRLAELMPELMDDEKKSTFNQSAISAVSKYGFTADDIDGIYDHRFMLILKDLIEYQNIISNKPKALEKVKGKPPLSPSKRQGKGGNSQGQLERFKKSGGKDMNALDAILDKFV